MKRLILWLFPVLRDLLEVLRGIFGRLDALESVPRPQGDLLDTMKAITALQRDLDDTDGTVAIHIARLDALEAQAKDFTFALSEGIERTDRAERRIAATVKRARQKLADSGLADAGLDTEADGLHLVDGERSEDVRVQGVPGEVAAVAGDASSVRGVPLSTMRRLRGM